jgi:hypothetical protein
VFDHGSHIANLEVKAIEWTGTEVTADGFTGEGLISGSMKRDNCAARLATKLHDAIRQFEGVSLPKILVFLNAHSEADVYDLMELLTGYLTYADGIRLASMPPAARGRSAADKARIDLHLWADLKGGTPSLIPATAVGEELKLKYFDGRSAE